MASSRPTRPSQAGPPPALKRRRPGRERTVRVVAEHATDAFELLGRVGLLRLTERAAALVEALADLERGASHQSTARTSPDGAVPESAQMPSTPEASYATPRRPRARARSGDPL